MAAIEQANLVLDTFAPGWQFRQLEWGLRLCGPDGRHHLVRLRGDRLWLRHRLRPGAWGGTTEQAICQLVLWVRGQPRRPLAWWKYICSPKVGLGSDRTVSLLAESSYPEKTGCVLCGAADPDDWWSLDGKTGPCCSFTKCRPRA